MGKKSKKTGKSRKQRLTIGASWSIIIVTSVSIIVAIFAYAFYHFVSIKTHLDYSLPASIEVERYVMNDSISYR